MIYLMLVSGLIGAMSAVGQAAHPAAPQAAVSADLVAVAPDHDFGTVTQGAPLVHAFIIRNSGTEPRAIERVELSAPGMTARFARTIPPGREGTITLMWDTATISGDVTAEAIVRFADPKVETMTLAIRGHVKPVIELLPYPAVFVSIFKGETAERRVRIMNNTESALAISTVEPRGSHFVASVEPVEAGRVHDLRVRVPADVPPGRYTESVVLHTSHPKRPRIEIAVNVLVKTDVYADPAEIEFGRVSLKDVARSPERLKILSQPVIVRKRAGTFEIRSIEMSLPSLVITPEPAAGSSGAFRLDVGLKPEQLRPGSISGVIRILTTDPDYPELVVKVSGAVE